MGSLDLLDQPVPLVHQDPEDHPESKVELDHLDQLEELVLLDQQDLPDSQVQQDPWDLQDHQDH